MLQPKLELGTPGDRYEREADRVADAVMRMTEPRPLHRVGRGIGGSRLLERGCLECEEELQRKPRIQRICAECEDELQRAPSTPERGARDIGSGKATPDVTPDVQARIDDLRGRGQPLPASARVFFEPRFGRDFGRVRIHADADAAAVSRRIEARAFTVGRNIAFAAGQYQPHTNAGRELLAHELTHTVQQQGTASQDIRRKIGDGHDLTAVRFRGNDRLEAAYDDELLIRWGARGDHVGILQQALIDSGFPLPEFGVDGIFGSETATAVRRYQADHGLKVDGIVGPETMADLDAEFADGGGGGRVCRIPDLESGLVRSFDGGPATAAAPSLSDADVRNCESDKPLCNPLPFPRNGTRVVVGTLCLAKQNAQVFDPTRTNPVDGSHNFCLDADDQLKILQRPNVAPDPNKLIMIRAEVLTGQQEGHTVFIQEAYINAESCKKAEKEKEKKEKKEKEKEKCIPTIDNPFCLPIPEKGASCTPFTSETQAQATWDALSVEVPLGTAAATFCGEVKPVWEAYFDKTSKPFGFDDVDSCVVKAAKEDETASKTAKASADGKLQDILDNLPNTLDDIQPLPFKIFGLVATKRISLSEAIGKHGPRYLHPPLIYNNAFNAAANIAGDIGGSDLFGDDDREMSGTVVIDVHSVDDDTGKLHGEVRWVPHIHVKDTVDFCPGNLGNFWQRAFTVPLSRLEATGMTRDVPITIDYNLELRSSKFSVIPKSRQK